MALASDAKKSGNTEVEFFLHFDPLKYNRLRQQGVFDQHPSVVISGVRLGRRVVGLPRTDATIALQSRKISMERALPVGVVNVIEHFATSIGKRYFDCREFVSCFLDTKKATPSTAWSHRSICYR
jgi:hypothetical protein